MKTFSRFLMLVAGVVIASALNVSAQTTVAIAATDADAAETLPGAPANPGNFRLTRTGSTSAALTVWVKVSGVAVQSEDYAFANYIGTSVVIPAGSATLDIQVNVIDDFFTEGTEDVRIKLDTQTSSGANVPYTIVGLDRAVVNIADNEDQLAPLRPILTVAAVDASAKETTNNSDSAIFRITRVNNLAPALNIFYSLGGTASNGVDYAALSGSIVMPAGAATVDVVVNPIDDAEIEGTESVTFALLPTTVTGTPLPAEAYAFGATTTAAATILDNDFYPLPVITITAPGSNAVGVVGRPMTVSFTASSSNAYITSYYIYGDSGGASGVNTNRVPGEIFSASATNITFLGTYFRQFSVGVTDSRSNSAYVTRSIYVINPPPPPPPPAPAPARYELFATDPDAAETAPGETPNPGKFLLVRTGAPGMFDFYSFTFSGTARQGLDYTVAYGTPVYTTNNTTNVMSQEITINPVDDYFYEGDETVKLELCFPIITFIENGGAGAPTGTYCTGDSTNANAYATLTIHDNELLASPYSSVTVAATDADAAEIPPLSGLPQNPGAFTITRTAPVANNLTVNFSLAGKAVNGVDFLAVSNFVVIPAGANSAQVVINPIYDLYAEGDEPVTLTLQPSTAPATNSAGYLLDTGGSGYSASVIIHDYAPTNIPVVKITVTDPIATTLITPFPYYPYNRTATMVVSRTGSLAGNLAVPYELGGSATNGVDYAALPGFVNFGTNISSAVITILPPFRTTSPAFEDVIVALVPPSPDIFPPPYLIGAPMAGVASITHYIVSYPQNLRRFPIIRYYRHQYSHTTFLVPLPPIIVRTNTATNTLALVDQVTSAVTLTNEIVSTAVTNNSPCFIIEASTDMVNWQQIGTSDASTAAGAVDGFTDPDAGNFPQRFYRSRPCP